MAKALKHQAEWAAYWQSRSDVDRNRLVELYLDDATQYANRLHQKGGLAIDREDAMQSGRIACITAVETFNPENAKQANFATWLTQKVYFALIEECRGRDFVSKDQRRRGVTASVGSLDAITTADSGRRLDIADSRQAAPLDYVDERDAEDCPIIRRPKPVEQPEFFSEEQRERLSELFGGSEGTLTDRNIAKIVGLPVEVVSLERLAWAKGSKRKAG